MKAMSVVLFVLLLVTFSQAQQTWKRTYGGTGDDFGNSVQQTSDGGYIIAGSTDSYGAGWHDVYLIRTDASGDTLWTRTYGGAVQDYGSSVRQTSDGGFIITGWTWSFGAGYEDVYLIKTDASGNTVWTRTYGGSRYEKGYSAQQTSDGGYIITGWTDSYGDTVNCDVWLIKTDASGDTLWTRTYGGTGADAGYSVQQTSDGGYIIAGTTDSYGAGYNDVYVIKTNASGDTLWTRTYGTANNDWGNFVQQTSEGGYIITGYANLYGVGSADVYLIKTSASGDTLWTRTYGGTGDDAGESVQQTTDGGYIIAGVTESFGAGSYDVYLIKTDASGDTLWTRTYGGTGEDRGESVQQTTDGTYIIAGWTYSFGAGSDDVWLIKTDANGNVGVEQQEGRRQKAEGGLKATPNPFVSFARVPGHEGERFNLYDVSGRKIGTYKGDRIGEGLSPGVYFLRPEQGSLKPLRIVKLR